MSHPAFQIIDEFLQAEDSSAQARRNAIVADSPPSPTTKRCRGCCNSP